MMLAVARCGESLICRRPCARVRSPVISDGLERRLIAEAFEAGSIVVVDELGDEGVPIGMVGEGPPRAAALVLAADGFGDAAVEAFDQAVGLRVVGPGQAMVDAALTARIGRTTS